MILDQNRVVLVASVICFQKKIGLHGLNHQIIEYWVSTGRYWLVLGGTGSEQGGTGCQYDELSENVWFAWSKSSNYWIFEEGKGDYGQTNGQTDRISSCRLEGSSKKANQFASLILTTFWLHYGCILMTTFWLHSEYFWYITLDYHWSKKIYRPKMIAWSGAIIRP